MYLISIVRLPEKHGQETGRVMSKAVIHFKESDTLFYPYTFGKAGGIKALHDFVDENVKGIQDAIDKLDPEAKKEFEEIHEDVCSTLDQKLPVKK